MIWHRSCIFLTKLEQNSGCLTQAKADEGFAFLCGMATTVPLCNAVPGWTRLLVRLLYLGYNILFCDSLLRDLTNTPAPCYFSGVMPASLITALGIHMVTVDLRLATHGGLLGEVLAQLRSIRMCYCYRSGRNDKICTC